MLGDVCGGGDTSQKPVRRGASAHCSISLVKSLRADFHAGSVNQVLLGELIAAAESPGIDFFEACAADDFAQILAIFEGVRRNDPELIRKHDFFNPAPDKSIAPQSLQLLRVCHGDVSADTF